MSPVAAPPGNLHQRRILQAATQGARRGTHHTVAGRGPVFVFPRPPRRRFGPTRAAFCHIHPRDRADASGESSSTTAITATLPSLAASTKRRLHARRSPAKTPLVIFSAPANSGDAAASLLRRESMSPADSPKTRPANLYITEGNHTSGRNRSSTRHHPRVAVGGRRLFSGDNGPSPHPRC